MNIVVKSVKVLKTGTNDYGKWTFVKVTTDDEEYTTFLGENSEPITPGSTLNISDLNEDEKGKSFKKYEIISPGEPVEKPSKQVSEPAPQEIGMWWKELGEMLRAKDIDVTKPAGKLMRTAYYAQMMSVLDIKIENKEG